jgi:small GTP-binding protein
MEALKEGLSINGPGSPVSRRDSDLDVDEEYERKMNMVNDTNSDKVGTGRDTIVDGSPVQSLFKHVKGAMKTTNGADPADPAGAAGSQAPEKARKIKLLMLGDSMVGKTSLMSRWTEDTFNPNLTSTLGVDFKMKTLMVEGQKVQVQVWDTAGQERFRKITKAYYRNAHGIVLCYDCTNRESFENITYWMENIQTHSGDGVQVCVVANKVDLRDKYHQMGEDLDRLVERSEGEPVAVENDVNFYETSAKEKTGVNQAFTELIAKVVRAQLESEGEEKEGSEGGEGAKKKKRFKIKSPKMVKSMVKGSKKMAKQQGCVVA